MTDPVAVNFDVESGGSGAEFSKYRVHDNAYVAKNAILLEYKEAGKVKKFKIKDGGMFKCKSDLVAGSALAAGDTIGWITGPCTHAVIMHDMCAVCGSNLSTSQFVEDKKMGRAQYVSMVHNVPGLVVATDLAKQISAASKEQLIMNRKLILLVDLDLTLIHTTNKQPRQSELKTDVYGFQLDQSCTYYTKIRPHALEFIERISKLYELHVVTYGQRIYANQVVDLLDRPRRYFANRILSREELISQNVKSHNLQALFPSGSELVVMIDDRVDVWDHAESLVWVKPYKFFTEVDDINDPHKLSEKSTEEGDEKKSEDTTNKTEVASDALELNTSAVVPEDGDVTQHAVYNGGVNVDDGGDAGKPAVNNDNDMQEKNGDAQLTKDQKEWADMIEREAGVSEEGEEDKSEERAGTSSTENVEVKKNDTDNILLDIEAALTKIHEKFFDIYRETQEIKNTGEIAANLRSQVLAGEVLVLSGIVQLQENIKYHPFYRTCLRLGAKVENEVTEKTTALIAAKARTDKYHQAKKLNIPIVTPSWVDECLARWKKVDKEIFGLPLSSEYSQTLGNKLSQMPTLAKEKVKSMIDEVSAVLDELSEDSEQSTDSDDEADPDEVPRKRSRVED